MLLKMFYLITAATLHHHLQTISCKALVIWAVPVIMCGLVQNVLTFAWLVQIV